MPTLSDQTPDVPQAPAKPRDETRNELVRWVFEITQWITATRNVIRGRILEGFGTPEAVVTARLGTLYIDRTNGRLYVKQTGAATTNTGWVLK